MILDRIVYDRWDENFACFFCIIEETAFYQLPKRIYQFLKPLDLGKKIRGKNSLPSQKLVNPKQFPSQSRINPAFRQKVRKTDGGYVV